LQPARYERVAKAQDEQFADRQIHERKIVIVRGLSKRSLDANHLKLAPIGRGSDYSRGAIGRCRRMAKQMSRDSGARATNVCATI
jgi:hypothetical protein